MWDLGIIQSMNSVTSLLQGMSGEEEAKAITTQPCHAIGSPAPIAAAMVTIPGNSASGRWT